MLFRNLKTSLRGKKKVTGCQGGQGSPRAVVPSEEVATQGQLVKIISQIIHCVQKAFTIVNTYINKS
jgi:hypothetical protein